MTAAEVAVIRAEPGMRVPPAYVRFVQSVRDDAIDATSVSDSPAPGGEMTRAGRDGEFGGTPWPPHLVFVGGETDACPSVLDRETGVLVRVEKDDPAARPIERLEDCACIVPAQVAG